MILPALPTLPAPVLLAVFAALGLLLGALHFAGLRWNSRLFTNGAPLWQPVLLQLLRLALTAAALLLCARFGALALLAALAGLLLARAWWLRRARSH